MRSSQGLVSDAAASSPGGEALLFACGEEITAGQFCNSLCEGHASLMRHWRIVHRPPHLQAQEAANPSAEFSAWERTQKLTAHNRLQVLLATHPASSIAGIPYLACMPPPRILGFHYEQIEGRSPWPAYRLQCQLCERTVEGVAQYAKHYFGEHLTQSKPVSTPAPSAPRSSSAAVPRPSPSSSNSSGPSAGTVAMGVLGGLLAAAAATGLAMAAYDNAEKEDTWRCKECHFPLNPNRSQKCGRCQKVKG
jgi:hypothetical protein